MSQALSQACHHIGSAPASVSTAGTSSVNMDSRLLQNVDLASSLTIPRRVIENVSIADLRTLVATNWDTTSKPNMPLLYFDKFPTELRLKIWKDALPEPRLVKAYLRSKKTPTGIVWFFSREASYHDSPNLLRVCKESRLVCLKAYHTIPIVIDTKKTSILHTALESFLYVDGRVDTVLVVMENTTFKVRRFLKLDLSRIEHMAVIYTDIIRQYLYVRVLGEARILDTATNLKSLSIVEDRYMEEWIRTSRGTYFSEPWLDVDDSKARFVTVDPKFQGNFISPYHVHYAPLETISFRKTWRGEQGRPLVNLYTLEAEEIMIFMRWQDGASPEYPRLTNVDCKIVLYAFDIVSPERKEFEEYHYRLALSSQ